MVLACLGESTPTYESPACATHDALPVPAEGCVAPGAPRVLIADRAQWTDTEAMGRSLCVGITTCAHGDRQLDLVYHDDACVGGRIDAWDRATGALVANLDPFVSTPACGAAPHWVGEDLSDCLPLLFTASAACRTAPLP